jgi:serine/threonine protein kinase
VLYKLLFVLELCTVVDLIRRHGDTAVYRAFSPSSHECVLKTVVLQTQQAEQLDNERLILEQLSLLECSGIIRVLDFGRWGPFQGLLLEPYGTTLLDSAIADPPSQDTLLRWARRLAAILNAVHDCGYVHGDMKPDNIISVDGDLCLIDFGYAARCGDSLASRCTGIFAPTRGVVNCQDDFEALCYTLYSLQIGMEAYLAAHRPSLAEVRKLCGPAAEAWRCRHLCKHQRRCLLS